MIQLKLLSLPKAKKFPSKLKSLGHPLKKANSSSIKNLLTSQTQKSCCVFRPQLSTRPSTRSFSYLKPPVRSKNSSPFPKQTTFSPFQTSIRSQHDQNFVKIGQVKTPLPSKPPPLHTSAFFVPQPTDFELPFLQWMLQKDALGQDMMLLGFPGKFRRQLALQFAQLTQRPYYYVSINRDTTEEDLKQRRELVNKQTLFLDQPPLLAAKNGGVLILDGIEKAERNLLPILNNLLENREMECEDGSFLISDYKWNTLLQNRVQAEIEHERLVQVSKFFRVVALSVPNPPFFPGVPIDPPLRSRFQIKYIPKFVQENTPLMQNTKAQKLFFFEETLRKVTGDMRNVGSENKILDFPLENVYSFFEILKCLKNYQSFDVQRIYPWSLVLKDSLRRQVWENGWKKFFPEKIERPFFSEVQTDPQNPKIKEITIKLNHSTHVFKVEGGPGKGFVPKNFVLNTSTRESLANLLLDHMVGKDIFISGGKGSGKTALAECFASVLGYRVETMTLFKDMNAKDLFATRYIDEEGNTKWKASSLIQAARSGGVCILDNLEEVDESVQSLLQEISQDRRISNLPDGSRLFNSKEVSADLSEKVSEIHPSFRLVALWSTNRNTKHRITPELLPCFHFTLLADFDSQELCDLISARVPSVNKEFIQKMVKLSNFLKNHEDSEINYTLRQILRDAEGLAQSKRTELDQSDFETSFLTKWIGETQQKILEKGFEKCQIPKASARHSLDILRQQYAEIPPLPGRATPETSYLVPAVPQFFHSENSEKILLKFNKFFQLGSHFLLIGPQGTGKNKLTDYFCQKNALPREYIQLHRDTTLSSLLTRAIINDKGMIEYEDSPVLKAIQYGRVLVVDEADKCNPEIVRVLKNLLEGSLTLADGRKLRKMPQHDDELQDLDPKTIYVHPHFRAIVLANKPGFPFHGNNFFSQCGDMFCTFEIDNPDLGSEIQLLSQYGPNVPKKTIQSVAETFQSLRSLSDAGEISYPFSTRESINITKHLQKYPETTISEAYSNVFDGDVFISEEQLEKIQNVLKQYGVALERKIFQTKVTSNPNLKLEYEYSNPHQAQNPKFGKVDPDNNPHVGGNTWAGGTGGRDTAGLGGKGGYMRLDSGNPIHQLSDEEKRAVPEELQQRAKEMGKEALRLQLEDTQLKPNELKSYQYFYEKIHSIKNQLKEALSVPEEERTWIKNSDQGELDQSKLVEFLAGSKSIYKQRKATTGFFQQSKSISFVLDVSASMYRFNRYDGRLDRMLQVALAVMESLSSISNISYEIRGHSGDDPEIEFVEYGRSPATVLEKFQVLRRSMCCLFQHRDHFPKLNFKI